MGVRRKGLSLSLTLAVQPLLALAVEQQLVVHVGQQELHTPTLHAQAVLHQDDGAAVVPGLWAGDQPNLVTAWGGAHTAGTVTS